MKPEWCSAFNPDHSLQCMGPRGHSGMHFAIDAPNYENPSQSVKAWWWGSPAQIGSPHTSWRGPLRGA